MAVSLRRPANPHDLFGGARGGASGGGGERASHVESAQAAHDIYALYGRSSATSSWASDAELTRAMVSGTPVHGQPAGAAWDTRAASTGGSEERLQDVDSAWADDGDGDGEEVYATPREHGGADYVSAHSDSRRDDSGTSSWYRDDTGLAYARRSFSLDFTRGDDEWSVGGHSDSADADAGVGQAVTSTDYVPPPEAVAWTPGVPLAHQRSQRQVSRTHSHDDAGDATRTPTTQPALVLPQHPNPMDANTSAASLSASPVTPTSSQHARADPATPDAAHLSPPDSAAASPVHPSITRIAGSARNGSGSASPSGNTSMAASSASLVSSQYPGEEADAYHVRSTYARLEIEGVYGDGWDEGIERTRGGISPGQRVTMTWPTEGHITDKERKFFSSLDRYGFVKTEKRTEGRLARVPAARFGKVPKVSVRHARAKDPPGDDSRGKGKGKGKGKDTGEPPAPPSVSPNGPTSAELARAKAKEGERAGKWLKMMVVSERDEGRNAIAWRWNGAEGEAKHATRVWKGIPDRWRMAAWWTLAEAAVERERKKGERIPTHDALGADYSVRKDLPSSNDVQIDLDVPRTISGHVLFRTRFGHGQRALFHVLHAFSQACGTCGYCQGMGSVAATLLCYFDPERTYTLMVRLHDQYNMHGLFAPGFPGLLETFYIQERLMEAIMPDVYATFKRQMISSSAWGAKIYITLFVNVVPFNVQLRLWDAMLLDGFDVMIMAVLALLWAYRRELAHPCANFESILSLLSSYYVPEDEDAMLDWMRRLLWQPGVRELIAHWRREWSGLVARGKAEEALL